ncbi:MAG: sensor histidine kinase [bacterium]
MKGDRRHGGHWGRPPWGAWWWRRGRPPWWPEDEPWPPTGPPGAQAWKRMRRHFLRRVAVGLAVMIILTAGLSLLLLWAVAGQFGSPDIPSGWAGIARLGLTVVLAMLLAAAVIGTRMFGRVAGPIGALLEAATRVSEGDYEVELPERGPREVRAVAAAFNKMTERLRANEEQRRSLLTDISHELRTPLAVIEGNLEGLIDGVYPRDDAHLALVLEEARVLERLIDDLRAFALAQDSGLRLARASTRLSDLAADVIASFTAQAESAGITLALDAPPEVTPVDVDPERIRQVLSNLLSNALRYTPRGGTVRLRCARDGPERIAVAVEDTGSGISAEDLPHVFERFYKSKDSRGTGLGLAIAKSLVAAHGGEISAASAPGGGTTIRFTLPV